MLSVEYVDENNIIVLTDCYTNGPGFWYVTDKQIVVGMLGVNLKESYEEADKVLEKISHYAFLAQNGCIIQCIEEDHSSLRDKIILKQL